MGVPCGIPNPGDIPCKTPGSRRYTGSIRHGREGALRAGRYVPQRVRPACADPPAAAGREGCRARVPALPRVCPRPVICSFVVRERRQAVLPAALVVEHLPVAVSAAVELQQVAAPLSATGSSPHLVVIVIPVLERQLVAAPVSAMGSPPHHVVTVNPVDAQ